MQRFAVVDPSSFHQHFRVEQCAKGTVERAPTPPINSNSREAVADRVVLAECLDDRDDIGVPQKAQPTSVEVIRQRAERLGPQRNSG